MKKILCAIAMAVALSGVAHAQSSPGLIYGQVPTAAQWNSYFAAKQDVIPYVTVNKAGDTMLGRLITAAPTTSAAMFNLPTGSAPTTPVNGDLWTTSSGLFVRIGGVTIGPLTGSTSSSFAATLPMVVTFPSGVTTYALNYDSNFALSGSNLALASITSGNIIANSTASPAEPTTTTLTAVIDRAISSVQGSILYRNSSGWVALGPGSAGQPLLSGGAAANPAYGTLGLSFGGTNAALTASNGGLVYSTGSALAILSGTGTANQIPLSGANAAPAWSTSTWPATTTSQQILYSSSANTVGGLALVSGGIPNYSSGGTLSVTRTPVLGVPGTATGTLGFSGLTSGTATITPQSTAGSPTLTLPNTSGTFAVGASSPLALSATTGNLTCATCVTSSGGGAITGTSPVSVSAAGVVSITGAAGQVLAGASPAFTATPTLGVAGSTVGSLAFANLTSGSVTLQPATGALGSAAWTFRAATDNVVGAATTDAFTNKTFNTAASGNVFQINGNGITGVTGSGATAVLAIGPAITNAALTTPTIGVATGTSLALGGATIGTDALAWTGTATGSGQLNAASFVPTGSTVPTNGMYLGAANQLNFSTSTTNRLALSTSALTASVNVAGNAASSFQLQNAAASSTAPTLIPNKADTTTGIGAQASGNISAIAGGAEVARFTSTGINNAVIGATTPAAGTFTTLNASSMTSSGMVQAGSASTLGISTDVLLNRDGTGTLGQRNGTAAQSFRVYNTFTDLANNEYGYLSWKDTANWLTLGTFNNGTGSARGLIINPATAITAFGGTTSSFPAIKQSGATLAFRLADDSGDATITAATQSGTDNSTKVATTAMVQAAISASGGGNVVGAASSVAGALPVWNGTTGKIIADSGYFPTQTQRLTSDLAAVTGTTPSNITGFSFNLTNGNTYRFRVVLFGNLGTGAIKVSMAGGSVTATTVHWSGTINTGGASPTTASLTGFQSALNGNANSPTSTIGSVSVGYMAIIEGTVTATNSSTLIPQICQNSSTGSGITVVTGSFMEVQQIP